MLNKLIVSRIFRHVLQFIFISISILYIGAISAPFLNQSSFWFISMLGVIFPVLFLAVLSCFIFLICKKSRWAFLFACMLVLGLKSIIFSIGFNFFDREPEFHSKETGLRVLSWNVFRWNEMNANGSDAAGSREHMLREVLMENADVMCFHEFFEPAGKGSNIYKSNIDVIRARGYTYYTFFPTSMIHGRTKLFGMAIFSKYPIVDSATYKFGSTKHSEGLMYADIKIGDDKIRIFTTHLESFKLGKSTYFGSNENGILSKAKSTIWSVRHAYETRRSQMTLVKEKIDLSPYPVLLLGNFGDVPNSETYTVLSENLDDAFLAKGRGFGRTFKNISPTLRLDYILVDKKMTVNKFLISESRYSDHYPIIAEVSLQ